MNEIKFTFHHVAISVAAIDASEEFYGAFGFQRICRFQDPSGKFEISHLRLGSAILELFHFSENQQAPSHSKELATDLPVMGVKHFGLSVSSIDNVLDVLKHNGYADAKTKVQEGKTGVRYVFIRDPDGILLEILEDSRSV